MLEHNIVKQMKRIAHYILLILFALSIYSCKKKNELPFYAGFPAAAKEDPIQSSTQRMPFTAKVEEQSHRVKPLFDYQIAGMVVSCGFSKSQAEYRKDKLNIMDVGLIWGSNLNPTMYQNIKFETDGVWLKASTDDPVIWNQLDQYRLSNNHLLCTDPLLVKRIKSVKCGDIISIKGCLASYSGRISSVSREDRGAKACETIWVHEFEVMHSGTKIWHLMNQISLYGILAWFVLKILALFLL